MLSDLDWEIKSVSINGCCNEIENKLIIAIHILAPLKEFTNNSSTPSY
jgi:hypothetical protein